MKNNSIFSKALKFVLKWEGGYVNDPIDRGGATNKGITQRTYNKWLKAHCLPEKDVKFITNEEVEKIYFQYYWLEANCHNMTDIFAVLCFDSAVNHGVGRVKQFLEAAEYKYPEKFIEARKNFYLRIVEKNPSQRKYLNGWMNRIEKLENFINTL